MLIILLKTDYMHNDLACFTKNFKLSILKRPNIVGLVKSIPFLLVKNRQ